MSKTIMTRTEIVAFSGTRQGLTIRQHNAIVGLLNHRAKLLHNGSARGADAQVAAICNQLDIPVIAHPAKDVRESDRTIINAIETREPKPPLVRNRIMIDEATLVITAPKGVIEERRGSGTWASIRYSRDQQKHLIVVWPDGSTLEQTGRR